jgi:hypothetical protein
MVFNQVQRQLTSRDSSVGIATATGWTARIRFPDQLLMTSPMRTGNVRDAENLRMEGYFVVVVFCNCLLMRSQPPLSFICEESGLTLV